MGSAQYWNFEKINAQRRGKIHYYWLSKTHTSYYKKTKKTDTFSHTIIYMRATGQSESEKRSGKNIYNKIKPLQKMSETQKADRICWEKQVCSRKNLKTNSILQGIT